MREFVKTMQGALLLILVWGFTGLPSVYAQEKTEATVEQARTVEDATPAAEPGMIQPKIDLPKFVKRGTPKDIRQKVPNLESDNEADKGRARVFVPEGSVNLALKKKVTGSDEEPIIGDLAMVTDGDKEAVDGSFVELGPGLQYVQIDLGQKSKIYAVAVWHYHQEVRVYHDVVIRIADDADFIAGVTTVFNNDYDNSARFGVGKDKPYIEDYRSKLISVKGVEGRYVRLYSNGSTSGSANHYIEVEVYGKPLN